MFDNDYNRASGKDNLICSDYKFDKEGVGYCSGGKCATTFSKGFAYYLREKLPGSFVGDDINLDYVRGIVNISNSDQVGKTPDLNLLKDIKSFQGIELFSGLRSFLIYNGVFGEINLSRNQKLENLLIKNDNSLTELPL